MGKALSESYATQFNHMIGELEAGVVEEAFDVVETAANGGGEAARICRRRRNPRGNVEEDDVITGDDVGHAVSVGGDGTETAARRYELCGRGVGGGKEKKRIIDKL